MPGKRNQLVSNLAKVGCAYQLILQKNPRHPIALAGISLIALVSKQTEAAIRMATAAAALAPRFILAWVALGQALKAASRYEEAEEAYRQGIRIDGMNPLARMGLGELMLATERPEPAIKEYELALCKNPAIAAAHVGLGHAHACLCHFDLALTSYRQALSLQPRMADAEFACGFALVRIGRPAEAEVCYRKALAIRPDFAAAWINLGSLQREHGQDIYSEASLRRALELQPELIGAWLNLGLLERDLRNPPKAEEYLRRAFELDPEREETHIAWCQFRHGENDLAGAWSWLRWVLARNPGNADALNMQGILLHTEGRYAEAVTVFEKAEELGNRAAASNRGNSLLDLGRMEEALRAHEFAAKHDPHSPGVRYNLALTQLRMGDYEHGWPEYEVRWEFREVHRLPRRFRQPRWQGEPLEGRRVLLHAEQGLGDSIQFSRYVQMVIAKGGTALLQVRTGVKRLMTSLEAVRSGKAEISDLGTKPPEFDLECPLMSLPAVFGSTVETVPWPGAYLAADHDLIFAKQEEQPALRSGNSHGQQPLRVGFAWAGNPAYKADWRRSTKPETFLPLLRLPGIDWFSLQKDHAARLLAELPANLSVYDACSNDRDLADTAAVIASLDLVISTDTCIAHLAGAMAKPVWILLPHLADWRWMQETETTPWYPTARLLRQKQPGNWQGLIERAVAELREFQTVFVSTGCAAVPPANCKRTRSMIPR
jgi:tetratricopeptide (TPR) repeat protein